MEAQKEALRWAPKHFFQQGHLSCFFVPGPCFETKQGHITAIPAAQHEPVLCSRFVPTQRHVSPEQSQALDISRSLGGLLRGRQCLAAGLRETDTRSQTPFLPETRRGQRAPGRVDQWPRAAPCPVLPVRGGGGGVGAGWVSEPTHCLKARAPRLFARPPRSSSHTGHFSKAVLWS